MAKLIIDTTGLAGLAPKFFGDANSPQGYGFSGGVPSRRASGGKGQMAQGFWNPFRIFGYMAPPTSMSQSSLKLWFRDATYNQNSEFVATLYDSLGTTGQNGKGVWAATKDTVFAQNNSQNGFLFHTIVDPLYGSTPRIQDLQVYQVNGVNKIFYSYQNTTGTYGDIGMVGPDGIGGSPTWFSTVAGGGGTYLGAVSNLVMVPSADNNLYLLDTNNLHRIDGTALTGGTNATVTQGVLIFPAERLLVDAVDFNGNLWIVAQTNQIGAGQSSASYNEHKIDVYSWNRQITTASTIQSVPLEGMQQVQKIYVTPDGDLRLIGTSTNRTVQIRRYNGATFEIMQELPIWAFPPYRDSCSFYEGMFCWIGRDGKIYLHGKPATVQGGTLSTSIGYATDNIFILGDASPLWAGNDASIGAILPFGIGTSGTSATPPLSLPAIIFSYASGSTYKALQWFVNGTGSIPGNDGDGDIQNVAQVSDAGNTFTLVQRLPGLPTVNYIRLWHLPNGSGGSTQMGTFTIYKNQSASALTNGAVPITQNDVQLGYKLIEAGVKGSKCFALQFKFSWSTNIALSDTADWLPYAIEIDYDETPALK